MATWIIGDVHGESRLLESLLDNIDPSFPEDTIIFAGDIINRGDDSYGCIELIHNMSRSHPDNVIAIMGNHEISFLTFLQKPEIFTEKDIKQIGCAKTIEDFVYKMNDSQRQLFVSTIANMGTFLSNDRTIITHAPIEPYVTPDNKSTPDQLMLGIRNIPDDYRHDSGKLVVAGHRRQKSVTLLKNDGEPSLLLLDTGAGAGGTLSACNLESVFDSNTPEIIASNRFRTFRAKAKIIENTSFELQQSFYPKF